jgi:glycine hydroxymethyltransferase
MQMTDPIEVADPQVAALISAESQRQKQGIQLIASENYAPMSVMEASGSVFTNKYAEGYPFKRYYEGCAVTDEVEQLAIDRAKELFGVEWVNVQAHSGSTANMGVYTALLEHGDTVLGMSLDHGGHLTHGSHVNFSGIDYNFVGYSLDAETEMIDMDQVEALANEHSPKMIVVGYSSYSRHLDYQRFRDIADSVGAIMMVDAAHFIGLVAGKAMPNPGEWADIVTCTTHKALRGPRGGMIMGREEFGQKIDKAVFPGIQGGAIFSQVAGKAVAFHLCAQPEYQEYARQILANASALADSLMAGGLRLVSGGTDNHLMLGDTRSIDPELTGKLAASTLDEVGITLNRNAIPNDPRKPWITSGIRLGTPSVTSAGMKEPQMAEIGELINRTLNNIEDQSALGEVRQATASLMEQFPPYAADFVGHV